jgi:hypothetical protein
MRGYSLKPFNAFPGRNGPQEDVHEPIFKCLLRHRHLMSPNLVMRICQRRDLGTPISQHWNYPRILHYWDSQRSRRVIGSWQYGSSWKGKHHTGARTIPGKWENSDKPSINLDIDNDNFHGRVGVDEKDDCCEITNSKTDGPVYVPILFIAARFDRMCLNVKALYSGKRAKATLCGMGASMWNTITVWPSMFRDINSTI